jgi:hypothetical protein
LVADKFSLSAGSVGEAQEGTLNRPPGNGYKQLFTRALPRVKDSTVKHDIIIYLYLHRHRKNYRREATATTRNRGQIPGLIVDPIRWGSNFNVFVSGFLGSPVMLRPRRYVRGLVRRKSSERLVAKGLPSVPPARSQRFSTKPTPFGAAPSEPFKSRFYLFDVSVPHRSRTITTSPHRPGVDCEKRFF